MSSKNEISKYIKVVDQLLNDRKLYISEAKPKLSTNNIDDNDLPKLDPNDPVHYATRYEPDTTQSYEQDFNKESIKRGIQARFNLLNNEEKLIIKLIYWSDLTPKEISNKTGFTTTKIHRIKNSALEKIRINSYSLYHSLNYDDSNYSSDELPLTFDSAIEKHISKIRNLVSYCEYPIKSQSLKSTIGMPDQVSDNLSYKEHTRGIEKHKNELLSILTNKFRSIKHDFYYYPFRDWFEIELDSPGYIADKMLSSLDSVERLELEKAFNLLNRIINDEKRKYIDKLAAELPRATKAILTGVEKYGIKDFSKKFNLTPETVNWFLQQR